LEDLKLMTPWMIEIDGDKFDLQELLRLNSVSGISITEEDSRYYLRSDEFNAYTKARDVLNRGTEVLKVINGIAQLEIQNWRNVRVCGVARDEANGTRTQFAFPEPIIARTRFSANATVIKSDGTVQTSKPQSTIESYLKIAKKDACVEKALRIYGSREHSWSNLYIIYEIIESDMGGKDLIIGNGWSSGSKIEKFKHTANSVSAAGDDARHGKENTEPPASPMPLSEAESMIGDLLKQWIRTK
jgi:hypothetical protein